MRTQVDAQLASAEAAHQHDPERVEIIARTRRFKAGWYELAEALTDVRKSERWRKWGFATFDDYTRRELHLRPDTVEKLTGSFGFLKKRAPEVLRRDAREAPLPTYQAVDLWRRAEEESDASKEQLEALRHDVLDEGLPPAQLARRYRDIFPTDAVDESERKRAQLKSAAVRLGELLTQAREAKTINATLAAQLEDPLARLIASLEN